MPPSPSRPRNKAQKRLDAERHGRRAEFIAELFLRCQFYAIAARRFRTPVGEIDLIASRFGTIVFVEVKARRNAASQEEALRAVNGARIGRAARYYLARHPALVEMNLRFDVIFLAPWAWPRHVRDAFDVAD